MLSEKGKAITSAEATAQQPLRGVSYGLSGLAQSTPESNNSAPKDIG